MSPLKIVLHGKYKNRRDEEITTVRDSGESVKYRFIDNYGNTYTEDGRFNVEVKVGRDLISPALKNYLILFVEDDRTFGIKASDPEDAFKRFQEVRHTSCDYREGRVNQICELVDVTPDIVKDQP